MLLPDGPVIPAILQRFLLLTRPLESIEQWSKEYGDTFRLLGSEMPPVVNFSSPEAIKQLFTASSEEIFSTQKSELVKTLVGANSIIFLEPEAHRRERKLIMPIFHKEKMVLYCDSIVATTLVAINKLQVGETILLRNFIQQITLAVILNVVFGKASDLQKEKLKLLLTNNVKTFNNPLFLVALTFPAIQQDWLLIWKNYQDNQKQIDNLIFSEIANRKTTNNQQANLDNNVSEDILGLLMAALDSNGCALSDEAIRDEIMTLIFAGFETTAAALSWSVYWVHYLPEVEATLRKEIALSLNNPSEIVKLPYLSAVTSETLRIYPVAISAFARTLSQPMQIEGYNLPAGTIINIGIYQAHHRPQVYPNPSEFRPERFLERNFSPYEFLPFGGGDRLCLGSALAQYEIKLVSATILKTMKLQLLDPKLVRPVRHGVAMIPPKDLKLKILSVSTEAKNKSCLQNY